VNASSGEKIAEAADKNPLNPKPVETPRPNNPSMAATAAGALSGVGASLPGNKNVNVWQDGGVGQINAFPSASREPTPVPQQPKSAAGIGAGVKQIGADIRDLPKNVWTMTKSFFTGAPKSEQPKSTASQSSTAPNKNAVSAAPKSGSTSVGTGMQTPFGEIATMAPPTQTAPSLPATAPNSVYIPYKGSTSTFAPAK
jgi:hypothetical protein